jgi:hypothetical protein
MYTALFFMGYSSIHLCIHLASAPVISVVAVAPCAGYQSSESMDGSIDKPINSYSNAPQIEQRQELHYNKTSAVLLPLIGPLLGSLYFGL